MENSGYTMTKHGEFEKNIELAQESGASIRENWLMGMIHFR
jgi:hypothetical protein